MCWSCPEGWRWTPEVPPLPERVCGVWEQSWPSHVLGMASFPCQCSGALYWAHQEVLTPLGELVSDCGQDHFVSLKGLYLSNLCRLCLLMFTGVQHVCLVRYHDDDIILGLKANDTLLQK